MTKKRRRQKTGWLFAKGARYKRYADRRRKKGVQYRDAHTGLVYSASGRVIGYEPTGRHVSGYDKLVKKLLKKKRKKR